MIDTLIEQLQKDLELSNPIPSSKPGVWEIPIEEGYNVEVTATDMGFCLTSSLGTLPEIGKEDFLQELMLANLFGQGTKGAALGLSTDGKKLMLIHEVDGEVNYTHFNEILEDFINTADLWKEQTV